VAVESALGKLREADPASLKFAPWGLAQLTPEQAANYYTELAATFQLPDGVPETTRLSFERVTAIFRYGVLNYDMFTVAGDQAKLALEQALRDRFLPFCNGTVHLRRKLRQPETTTAITVNTYDDVLNGIRQHGRHLILRDGDIIEFDGMLDSLLRWARRERLLTGQRDRLQDRTRVSLRNIAGHQGYHRDLPGSGAAAIKA